MFRELIHRFVNYVAVESTSLALLRIRATAALPAHDIRGRSPNTHHRRSGRR